VEAALETLEAPDTHRLLTHLLRASDRVAVNAAQWHFLLAGPGPEPAVDSCDEREECG